MNKPVHTLNYLIVAAYSNKNHPFERCAKKRKPLHCTVEGPTQEELVIMSGAGGSPTTRPHVMRLAIIAVVFVVMSLAAILGPTWVGFYALSVVVIVGGSYGALTVARWMIGGPKRIVAYGVAFVFLALVGGCVADSMIPVAPEDMKRGCHMDYYLWVFPTGHSYCAD